MKSPRELAEEIIPSHFECEDSWYSCPLSDEGCAKELDVGCTCLRDKRVNEIENALIAYGDERIEEAAKAAKGYGYNVNFNSIHQPWAHSANLWLRVQNEEISKQILALKTKKAGESK